MQNTYNYPWQNAAQLGLQLFPHAKTCATILKSEREKVTNVYTLFILETLLICTGKNGGSKQTYSSVVIMVYILYKHMSSYKY